MANGVQVVNGLNSASFSKLVGKTVYDAVDDAIVQDYFNLSGDESVSVNGVPVDGTTVLKDGDVMTLSRSGGTKG